VCTVIVDSHSDMNFFVEQVTKMLYLKSWVVFQLTVCVCVCVCVSVCARVCACVRGCVSCSRFCFSKSEAESFVEICFPSQNIVRK
jgi:hypothetical protein